MGNDVVRTEESDGILSITISRPEALNAVNLSVAEGIAAALERLDGRPELRIGIIAGEGGNFSAGMDLKAFVRGESPTVAGRGFAGIVEAPPEKPLIAAVEGYALAGGFEIVLACDLIVASATAKFGLPEVKRGLMAAAGGLLHLPKRIPYHVAMEIALTGEPIDAARARQLGLVNRITPEGEALAGARRFAEVIASNGPLATAASKRIVVQAVDWDREQGILEQNKTASVVQTSEDAIEGGRAFIEKRVPVWRGR